MARESLIKQRDLLTLLKGMVAIISELAVDAAELELSNSKACISRQIKQLIILDQKSKEYRQLLKAIRVEIISGKPVEPADSVDIEDE